MLVALLSVATSAIQAMSTALEGSRSFISISNPVAQQGAIFLIAGNSGRSPGMVTMTSLTSKSLPSIVALAPRTPADTFVAPGAKQAIFDVQFFLGADESSDLALKVFTANPEGGKKAGTLAVNFVESDGREGSALLDINSHALFNLLMDHARRCKALKEKPSIDNRCQSPEGLHAAVQAMR